MTVHTSDILGDDPYGKAGDAIRFLQAFDPNGWHNLVAFDPFSGKPIDACTFAPGAWGKMAHWINRHIEQHNLYFSVGEPKPRSPNNKLKKSHIASIRALFADLDPEGGVEEFDSERARIRLRVEELLRGPLPPSFVIDSGGGMQVFWKLDQSIKADAASQDHVENIGRAIAHALKADAVQNIDRIMRLPVTTNFPNAKKRRKGRTVRPTVLMDASGIQHGIDDIAKEFPIPAGERARSRAEAADWAKYSDRIDHEEVRQLDAYDDLPGALIDRFDKLLADNAKLRAMWEHGEKEEGGRTGSDYVYALGRSLHWHGFDIEDFARLARVWRFTPGNSGRDVNASPRALGRIWAKAEAMRKARTETGDPPPGQAGDPGVKGEEDYGGQHGNGEKHDSRYTDYGADPREGWNELPRWEGDPEQGENARPIRTKSSKPSAKTGIELFNFQEYRTQFKSSEQSAIDGLCRFGTVLGVSSRPSWGKTALLIHMSQCLSSGTAFLGRETAQCSIAYIATEDIEDVVNRMEAVGDDKLLIVKSPEGLPLTKPKRAKEIVLEVIRQARKRNPDRSVFVVVDTFRAAMGEQSVIDDRYASPALNALREVAEQEKVLIGIANHTNRENTKQTKGETLEAVAATELILVQGDGDWYNIFVGKNRSGPGHKQIGRVRYTSVEVGDVHAAIVEEIVADEPYAHQKSDNRKYGANQRLVMRIVGNLVVDAEPYYPYGAEGPCVKAVREGAAREEFVSRRAGEERNPKVKAFTATLQSLLDKGDLARGENSKAEGMLWYGIKETENSARHEVIDGG